MAGELIIDWLRVGGNQVRAGRTNRNQNSTVFIPGTTEPYYEITTTFDTGSKNVGNIPGVALTTYTGTITNGVAVLTRTQPYENVLFPCVVDIQGPVTLNNCRIVVPLTYTAADSIRGCIRAMNGGAAATGATLNDCEIHNRAQRPMNGVFGRNVTGNRLVVTGCVDAFTSSTGGTAPQNYGLRINDSYVGALAWWYSNPANPEVHDDPGSHSDGIQHGTALDTVIKNTVLLAYVDEIIGTGTPGSGSETNPYNPATGNDYIVAQATMEGWRTTYCNYFTPVSQSKYGVSHRLPSSGTTSGTSYAAAMINRENIAFDHCYFGGGLASINMLDAALTSPFDVQIENCTFWNDMRNPVGRAETAKGHAVLITTGKTGYTFVNNKWSDGTAVAVTFN